MESDQILSRLGRMSIHLKVTRIQRYRRMRLEAGNALNWIDTLLEKKEVD